MMKTKKIVLLMSGISLMFSGCTTETRGWADDGKITRVYVDAPSEPGGLEAESRTATDEYSVTWVAGDEVALFKAGDRTNYKRFRLMSEPGSKAGYFAGATSDDYLTEGDSYKVVYPYSAAEKTGTNNGARFPIYEIRQAEEGNKHLADYDWLESTYRTVSVANPVPAFVLNHCFALLKITLTVEGTDEDNDDYEEYLTNLTIAAADNSEIFAQRVFLDSDINVGAWGYRSQTVTYRDPKAWLSDGTYTFWLVMLQDATIGIKELQFSLHFSHGLSGSVLWNLNATHTPSSVLKSGHLYKIHLRANIDGAARSGNLEVVSLN